MVVVFIVVFMVYLVACWYGSNPGNIDDFMDFYVASADVHSMIAIVVDCVF